MWKITLLALVIPGMGLAQETASHNIIRSEHRKAHNIKRKDIQDAFGAIKNWQELDTYLTSTATAEDKEYLKMVLEEQAHLPFQLPRLELSHDGWILKTTSERAKINSKVKTVTFENRMMIYDKKSLKEMGNWLISIKPASQGIFLGLSTLISVMGKELSQESCVKDYAQLQERLDASLKDCKSSAVAAQESCLRVLDEELMTFGYLDPKTCIDETTRKEICEKAERLSQCLVKK